MVMIGIGMIGKFQKFLENVSTHNRPISGRGARTPIVFHPPYPKPLMFGRVPSMLPLTTIE